MSDYVVNYTPHTVTLLYPDGTLRMSFPSKGIARAVENVTQMPPLAWDPLGDCGMIDSLPIVSKSFGTVVGLPGPSQWVRYIVSQVVQDALPNRTDLLVPHGIVHDHAGLPIGCTGFAARTPAPELAARTPAPEPSDETRKIVSDIRERAEKAADRLPSRDADERYVALQAWIAGYQAGLAWQPPSSPPPGVPDSHRAPTAPGHDSDELDVQVADDPDANGEDIIARDERRATEGSK